MDEQQAPPRMDIPAGRPDPGERPAPSTPAALSLRRYRKNDVAFRRRRPRYTNDMVLDELRRVAALVQHRVLSIARYRPHGRIGCDAILRRFGLWRTALERAGLEDRWCGRTITDKLRRQRARRMSNDELLAELRAIAAERGRDTVTAAEVNASRRVSVTVYYKRFGSYAQAVAAAGLKPSKYGPRYSDELCFTNLMAVWRHHGRAPRGHEMDKPPSIVSLQGYRIRFRSFRRALALLALRANAAGADPPFVLPDRAATAAAARERRRQAPGSLRFKVIERDCFRCVACGNSPATDPACKLHVDHIEPFSKGGRTTLDNLRTLCAACNWSRGDGG